MSDSGRKRSSKWDSSKEDSFHPEGNGRNGSRRCGPEDDDEHLKPRQQQHSGEVWPTRSRASHGDDGDAMMMDYYNPRKASEPEKSRQQYFRHSPPRDRPRSRRSGSRSNSRSRSRSPLQRVVRDGGGSYDRHKTKARVSSPRSGREIDGRYSRAGDYDFRKTRDTKYYTEDSREQHPVRVSEFPDDNNSSRRETSDPVLRSHRTESGRDRETTQRRDVPAGEFYRSSNVPCRFFASGYCRNGNSCRFSHLGAPLARGSPERKLQDEMFSRHDNSNIHSGTAERARNSHRWNDIERSDAGKHSDKATSEAKGNNASWIDNMEMSPDWNYRVKTLEKPVSEEHSQRVLKDTLAPAYEHGSTVISQQDGNRMSIGTVSSSHHNFNSNLSSSAPPVEAFTQNIENHSAVPYQSAPLAVGGSQVLLQPSATNLHGGLSSIIPENGNAQNTVSREELNHISNISASLAQFFGNGQPVPHLHPTLNTKQATQVPEVYGNKDHSSQTQSNQVPVVTALQMNNSDTQQVQIPDNLVSLAGNLKASCEENRGKKTDEEASKEPDGRKTGEEKDTAEDAGNVGEEEEEEDMADDENNKKGKDPKGVRAFKFALVEIVKELLKPAWKEGGMNKDAYKNIVKKVVDKVTGAIQTGNIPQTQEKIDHYLAASKPKLTKLVQAYISKVKKS